MTAGGSPLGMRGEAIAGAFLARKGYEILDRNYHSTKGEIDIIIKHPDQSEYVLVEVKTRTSSQYGTAEESVTPAKITKMLGAAEDYFLKKMNLDAVPDIRVDVIALEREGGKVLCRHFEDVGEGDSFGG